MISGNDYGVFITNGAGYSAKDNRVLRNVISRNTETGVSIDSEGATGTRVLSNSVFANGLLGIAFYDNPVPTANDTGDADTGANGTGNASIAFSTKKAIRLGQNITATATSTSTGDTSEFSAPRKVVSAEAKHPAGGAPYEDHRARAAMSPGPPRSICPVTRR